MDGLSAQGSVNCVIHPLPLGKVDEVLYPMTRCYIRKFYPIGEAKGEGDTSALCSILTRGCANSEVTRPPITDTLGELSLCLAE